jgi:hypothetical protein
VAGPPGYCVDPAESRDGVKAFVLLGSCASVARNPYIRKPATPGLVTVVVSSDPSTFLNVRERQGLLADYFRSAPGRAALSRTGRAETVRVDEIRNGDGILYIRATDSGRSLLPGMAESHWRALFDVNGRLVTVSVSGFTDKPMSAEDGFRLVRSATERIRSESARL